MGNMFLTKAKPRHLRGLLEIERGCFDFPWDPEDFLTAMNQPDTITGIVIDDDRPVGYIVVKDQSDWTYGDHLEIMSIAVVSDRRREGIASLLVSGAIKDLFRKSRHSINALVRESNLDAQLFLRANGFKCLDIVRKPWKDVEDDGYLFVWRPRKNAEREPAKQLIFCR